MCFVHDTIRTSQRLGIELLLSSPVLRRLGPDTHMAMLLEAVFFSLQGIDENKYD